MLSFIHFFEDIDWTKNMIFFNYLIDQNHAYNYDKWLVTYKMRQTLKWLLIPSFIKIINQIYMDSSIHLPT